MSFLYSHPPGASQVGTTVTLARDRHRPKPLVSDLVLTCDFPDSERGAQTSADSARQNLVHQICMFHHLVPTSIIGCLDLQTHAMFKKFSHENINSKANVKSSSQRALKAKLVAQFPDMEPVVDQIIPKKAQLVHVKCQDRISLYTIDGKVMFFQHFDDELVPSLHLVHQFPQYFPSIKTDRGAIKFVLSGANIMCRGLTSKGAELPDEPMEKDQIVIVNAEGKEHALAVGKLTMSTKEIEEVNNGIGVELLHYLGDGLWSYHE
ncbi:hypothetical protein LXG23DRAFT_51289 [Yarrowia lipolytica]|uniref:Translation machinery-associated protein 20 n=1 Tax=Yarrowia lipolytica TaxID=4952 RepID=A0A1D8N558_YARLL|nr:hypothetical protein YALI1_A17511g [Yarrowia lipolytica]KAB8281348.1 hypothetical protein BKA91DRAFT_140321 [Yarrowia lipolytica]KAE8169641.1 hypothetical protein BKA90DRAFT_142252 [Yarrowia lipolytica]KAJ8051753.1 hypothetical protein LXG23DRAFT_51289 [Yarrowia lipolytica]RMI95581.1 hypothetical protein BD777DRAFT_130020 [Yarrowia lipolytica]